MNKSFKNLLLLLGAFIAALLLQVVAAFAVMMPAMAFKQMQIISMGLQGTPEETEMINELTMSLMGLTVVVTHVFLLVGFALWYVLGCCDNRSFKNTVKKTFRGKNVWLIVLLAASGCYLTNFAMPLASMIIPENIMQAYMDLMETAGFGESILTTVAAILIAPFGEELIFRGVCYHYACGMTSNMPNRRKAFYIANTIQALGFGIFHGNLVQGAYAFFLGLLLGYLRERFGSIWAPILAHMIVNGISSFLWEPLYLILPETMLTFVFGTIICLAILVLGLKISGAAVEKCDKTEVGKNIFS